MTIVISTPVDGEIEALRNLAAEVWRKHYPHYPPIMDDYNMQKNIG